MSRFTIRFSVPHFIIPLARSFTVISLPSDLEWRRRECRTNFIRKAKSIPKLISNWSFIKHDVAFAFIITKVVRNTLHKADEKYWLARLRSLRHSPVLPLLNRNCLLRFYEYSVIRPNSICNVKIVISVMRFEWVASNGRTASAQFRWNSMST